MKCITLSLLKLLEDNGFGKIDENLFWEKLGLGLDGLYIADIGSAQDRTTAPSTMYELYSRAKDDFEAYQQLQTVRDFLERSYTTCNLPAVPPYTDEGFSGVTIMPPSTVSNNGIGEDGHIIYSITGRIYY